MRGNSEYQPIHQREVDSAEPLRVLVPIKTGQEAEVLLPFAESITRERQGQLWILQDIQAPKDKPLSEAASVAIRMREKIIHLLSDETKMLAQIKTMVRVKSSIWQGIWETVNEENIKLLIFAWKNEALPDTAVGDLIDPQLANPPCNVVSLRLAAGKSGPQTWQSVKRILLPVRGGPNSTLVLRVGHALAQRTHAEISLLHVTQGEQRDQETQFFDEFYPAMRGLERITRSVTTKREVSQAIAEEAIQHDIVVMGAPFYNVRPDGWNGPLLDSVRKNIASTLIIVKEHRPVPKPPVSRNEPITQPVDRPVALVVDRWFATNTYHSREFSELDRLVALKEKQGVTISLGLPALNEQETVGKVIRTLKSALMEQVPLLDEVVLIDSGSVDYTREIAADLGIDVYIHQEILPEYGAFHGKGEALWKSLHVLKGDLIAWVDTDIKNIHPRFVYGILGPLLRVPHIQYVKGFYRRPLIKGDKIIAGGGGRVTELTARPFINMFYPELSGLIQPLSGEYAGRRSALESIPFFTGYGVETGMLIDLENKFGLSGIAQVDLLERIHHNQPLPNLSRMSFLIMQVVLKRLGERHQVHLLEEANLTMNLIRYGMKHYFLEPEEIRENERPPMLKIPEYRRKRGLEDKNIAHQMQEGGILHKGVIK
ncbi:MAG: glucosyl-3-phosphoglycerate synthase [Anaerolineales bacterium]|jgi:nucleotide-binding universal stress UspA family protein